MPFLIPAVSPHADHTSPDTAPDGTVELTLECFDGDCAAGDLRVAVLAAADEAVLAEGPVACTGGKRLHSLPLGAPRALAAVRVRVRFTCGAERAIGWEGRLWIRATGRPAGPTTRGAAARGASKRGTAKRPAGPRRPPR